MSDNTRRKAEGEPDQPGLNDEEGNKQHVTGQKRAVSIEEPTQAAKKTKMAQPGEGKNQKEQYKR